MLRIRSAGALAGALLGLMIPAVQAQAAPAGGLSGAQQANAIMNRVLDRLIVASDAHWHKGEYNHIVNLSRMVLVGDPANTDTRVNAGWLLWSMGRDDEAVALYEQGLKANANTYALYDELGMFYMDHKKDYPKAVLYYEKAAACKDCPPITLHMLAHAYERNKQLDRALATWKRAMAMPNNPNLGAAKNNMERVQRLIAEKDRPKS